MAASKATEAMIGTLIEKVFFALLTQAQYALDFKDQLEVMKTKLELMTAFISCTDKQKTRGKFMQKILPNLRKLIYEADDIMKDCQIRDEYRKDGFCHRFSLRDLFFIYQTGKDLKHINSRIEKMESSLGQIGIVGMGGLGKTTIAQKIFNDREMVAHFEKRIWVPVSQNFSEERRLSDKTCLIVMDNVWRMNLDLWKNLYPTEKRCFIIITSRNETVVNSMGVDESRIHRPKILNEEESREILKKCGGLPLAIKTIGGLLAPKVHSLSEWNKINDDFHVYLTTERENNSVVASLRLSYDELPTHLKQCLMCFSVYPNFEISGLIRGRDNRIATELGFDYLSELVSRCLVEVVHRRGYDGRVYSCKMHDLKLIILDLGSCPLQYLSHGLEKLIYLQELSGFRVASQSNTQGCRLNALLGLKQLRVLQMSINNESEISEDEWNDGDISNFEISSESDQDSNGTTWVLEGLCLKFVPNLDLDWNVLLEDMPILRYA
ncbi:hypothetical protein CUMW_229970, partial [Citrus unshiu]